ncbi:Peptidase C1A papain C-terminal domain-containing protein [Listeria booriae]|uniref:Peptidase C1A papain C-terminal domain-containing protein n=1 Tax=Listeria booriae TaxID=1552123 RepID=A0A099VWM4_9LIST|nr:C1 family peptidase [Listeria booriae]KGL37934.1 hypothetical protein EP57_15360 [Listeria booriae]STY45931.1 Internalin-J precursor [Listeria booriae]
MTHYFKKGSFTLLLTILISIGVLWPTHALAENLPTSFDPRATGTTTPVKQQTRNICWSFATIAATEQNYVKNTGIKIDLAENYFNYALAANITGKFDWSLGVGGALDSGYDSFPVLEKMMTWKGPVLETTFPNSIVGYQPLSILGNRPAALHVQGFTKMPGLTNYKENTATEITDRVNAIKNNVQKYGNVISARDGLGSYRGDYNTQNLLPERVGASNHVVTLVGWDDSFDKNKFTYPPARNGAFIAKNSWGANWGDNGYYYISYEDAYLRAKELYTVTSVEPATNYSKRYGEARTMGGGQLSTAGSKVIAHVFDAPKASEKIDAISIQTEEKNVSYEIYVNPTTSVTTGLNGFTKVKSGTKADIGAETIKLDNSIPITATDKFSVAIKYTKPDNVSRILIPTDSGIVGVQNVYNGYTLNDNNTWQKQTENYLFNVYTNSTDPSNPGTIIPDPEPKPPSLGIIKELFPDPVFAAEIARQIEKTVDDTITQSEAEQFKSINLSGYNNKTVSDATGLTYLTNLTYLKFQKGNLTTIDLSKNTKLIDLYLDSNNLTTLDLRSNPALTWVDAMANKLTSIDVTNCPRLDTLQIPDNKLTTINTSNNPSLSFLSLGQNSLTSMDVSKNTALTWLQLGTNKLTSIDISKNTKLIVLNIGFNNFTKIDVSQNVALNELNVMYNQISQLDVTKNPFLKYLSAPKNQLTSLDVSKNSALENLSVGNNRLSDINLSHNVKLVYLSLNDNKLRQLDVSSNVALKSLSVENNQIATLDLSKNVKLQATTYYVSGNIGISVIPPAN